MLTKEKNQSIVKASESEAVAPALAVSYVGGGRVREKREGRGGAEVFGNVPRVFQEVFFEAGQIRDTIK